VRPGQQIEQRHPDRDAVRDLVRDHRLRAGGDVGRSVELTQVPLSFADLIAYISTFTPLRPERVVEVRYEHMEGVRFRHTAQFVRWRPDRTPESCTYEQLEQPLTFALNDIVPGLRPTQN